MASCVEVNVRRTIAPDLSGRQTITMRVPKDLSAEANPADIFPGSFAAATVVPTRTQTTNDATVYSADVVFPNVTRLRQQVEFLASAASVQATRNGVARYRETVTNNFFRSLSRAPSAEGRNAVAAAMEKARAGLAGARFTYTICFPGKVVESNADRVSGNEATWRLTSDRLFAKSSIELTAEYRTSPEPAVVASPAATPGFVPVKAAVSAAPQPERAPEPPAKKPAPRARPQPKIIAAPAASEPAVAPKRPEPEPQEPIAVKPQPKFEDIRLAQADPKKEEEKAPKEGEKGKPAAAPPAAAPVEPPKAPATLADAPSDDAKAQELKKLFRDALIHLDYKRYDKAVEVLQKAIALKPNSVLVADLYQQTVPKFIDAALESNNPKLKALAEQLQRIAYRGRIEQLKDPGRMKKIVRDLAGPFPERTLAIEILTIAGDYAVPHLVDFLQADADPNHRAYAAHVLARLRGTAVPPICEALKCPDPMIRQIIIHSLEAISDARAIPWLLWMAQEPKGHPLVVAAARRAVAKLSNDPKALQTPASVAFLRLAEDFYFHSRKVLLPHLYEHLVWRWDPEARRLTSESVPRHLYPYRMAEEMCRNALLANPDFELATPMLICTYFAQQNLLEAFFIGIKGKGLKEEEKKEAELAKAIRERLKAAPLVAQAAGKRFVYAALRRALRDAQSDVAISCIKVIRQIADGSALPKPPSPESKVIRPKKKERKPAKRRRIITWYGPKEEEKPELPPPPPSPFAVPLDGSPLVDALTYPADRRVRYAAAEAIVAVAPSHMIRGAAKVITTLSEALSETAYHMALMVDEDQAAAEELRPLLRDLSVASTLARTQRDALIRARDLPPKDIIILSGQLQKVDVVEMLASLRRVPSLAVAPVLVVSRRRELAALRQRLAKENVTFLIRPFDAKSVRFAVEQLVRKAPEPKGKEIAARYASSAARTLASIDPATSIFRLADALDALLNALTSTTQPDEVRVPCCEAIRRTRSARALPYLVEVYNDPKSSKLLRLAALISLGACAAAEPALPKDVADVLTRASYHDDRDFRETAARAFGLRGGAGDKFLDIVDHLHGKKPKEGK